MIRTLAVAITAFLAMLSLTGAHQWRVNGKPAPDTPWSKSDGNLGAYLTFTDRPEKLFADRERQGAGVFYSETKTAKRSIPIIAVIFFKGCAPDDEGLCNTAVRFTAYTPDGKVWGKPHEGELWVNKPSPPPDAIQLSVGNMGIVVDPDDPLGTYKVRAEIHDKIAKKKMVLERTFTAHE